MAWKSSGQIIPLLLINKEKSKMVAFRKILAGRSSIALMILIPITSLIIYFSLWDRSQADGPGGLYWTPPGSTDVDFVPSALFKSFKGNKKDADRTNILVHYLDNDHGDACSSTNIRSKVGITVGDSDLVALAIDRTLNCYPEEVAKAAKEAGYTMVISQSPFYAVGFQASQLWKSNSAPIPVMEINNEVVVKDLHLAYVNISRSESILVRSDNEAVLYALSASVAILGFIQVIKAFDRISGISIRPFHLNTRGTACILQFFSGIFRVIYAVDLVGSAHRFNFVFFRILLSLGMIFVFSTIFNVAFAYHFALVRLSNGPTNIREVKSFWVIGFVILVLILIEIIAGAFSVILSPISAALNLLSAINAFCFQLFSGVYFIWTKHKVVANLKRTVPSVGNGRLKEIERMAQYLYLSVVPMILFLFTLVFYLVYFYMRDFQIITLSLSAMLLSITEITLISSFPRKKIASATKTDMRPSSNQ